MAWVWVICFSVLLTHCSSLKGALAIQAQADPRPIANPFDPIKTKEEGERKKWVIRSKRPDASLEIEVPDGDRNLAGVSFPLEARERQASQEPLHRDVEPERTISDREITSRFPSPLLGKESRILEIEQALGVKPTDDQLFNEKESSYLASLDKIKTLFRDKRYEMALMETDVLIQHYPTDTRAHTMRGTLLHLLGEDKLALGAWEQALKMDPKNRRLKRFLERKRHEVHS
jgi:tetratricopeptide (TPR) repeat protein